jgi:putative serine protease PepD
MSEIDRPGSQSQQPNDGDKNYYAPTAGTPAPASSDATAVPPPPVDAFPAAAATSAAPPPPFSREAAAASGATPSWHTPVAPVSATPATAVPVSGGPGEQTAWQQPVYASGQQPVYATGGYPPVPPSGPPAWTPPASNGPKRVPTAVKVLVGSTAAVVLALCSGVTGAVVATAINDNGGISLPVSTDAAPVVSRDSLAGVAQETQPSVVNIATGSGEGSGVILTADGYILTNNHVVESASGSSVTVTLSDGKKVKAKVLGTDPKTDLAVVKAEATGLKAATLGDSNRVAVGDTVLAIGSPLGLQGSVTSGIISAKDRTIGVGEGRSGSLSGLLQTDAPINPGNSGGALVNMAGDVIGINTAIATSGGGEGNIGVGFAIPSNKAKTVAEQLMKGQKVSHPFLGVSVTPNETGGAKIGSITANSPAAAAGLKEGDVITKFGNRVVNDSDDLVSAVQSGTVGDRVTVEFNRNGETMTATVTLAEAS